MDESLDRKYSEIYTKQHKMLLGRDSEQQLQSRQAIALE
jgi:hypothetical protein